MLWDFSQATLYNTQRYKRIISDCSENPPGFTLLWIHGVLCISSSVHRNNLCTFIGRPEITVHGPCSSGRYHGLLEYDIAHFFISEFASSWSNRCHAWLPPHVVDDIIKYGCHFVAFGKHAENEWYTQFLIYGLPKYFVKEFN